ncbi:MAG: helix-hairpin-helix domain-containing protein, partial [Candidatus Kapaibacteriota bacterium]
MEIDKKLVKLLRNISILLQIKGENIFKAQAYAKAADIIEAMQLDVHTLAKNGKLGEIEGFGEALVKKITEYVETGRMSYYDRLTSEVPVELVSITKIPGIGPKKTKILFESLGIKSIDDLERACIEDKVSKIKGFSIKSQEIILNSIQHIKAWKGKRQQFACFQEANNISNFLKSIPEVQRYSIVGEMRRYSEIVTSVHFLASTLEPHKLISNFGNRFNLNVEANSFAFQTEDEILVRISFCHPRSYIWQLHNLTGSDDYIKSFSEFFENKTNRSFDFYEFPYPTITFETEEQLFDWLGIQYITPELRESNLSIQRAIEQRIPRLIQESDMRGMVHVHSTWSD